MDRVSIPSYKRNFRSREWASLSLSHSFHLYPSLSSRRKTTTTTTRIRLEVRFRSSRRRGKRRESIGRTVAGKNDATRSPRGIQAARKKRCSLIKFLSLSVKPSFLNISLHPLYLFIYSFVCLFIYLFIYLYICIRNFLLCFVIYLQPLMVLSNIYALRLSAS